jgi:hypothetical protein
LELRVCSGLTSWHDNEVISSTEIAYKFDGIPANGVDLMATGQQG